MEHKAENRICQNCKQNFTIEPEDFSFYGTKAPAFFFYLGGAPKGSDLTKAPPHHTPDFYVDNTGMITGVRALCAIVTDYFNAAKTAKPAQSK